MENLYIPVGMITIRLNYAISDCGSMDRRDGQEFQGRSIWRDLVH